MKAWNNTWGNIYIIVLVWIQISNDSNNQILMLRLQQTNRTVFLCLFKGKWDFNVIGSSIKPFSNIQGLNDSLFQSREWTKYANSKLQVIIRRWKYNRSSALWITIDFFTPYCLRLTLTHIMTQVIERQ